MSPDLFNELYNHQHNSMVLPSRKSNLTCRQRIDAFLSYFALPHKKLNCERWMLVAILLLLTLSVMTSFVVTKGKPTATYTGLIIADSVEDEQGIDPEQWAKLKIAVYMTTHLSQIDKDFLTDCWPYATRNLKIFHHSDLIIYSSEPPDPELLEPLIFQRITVKLFPQVEIPSSFFFFASKEDTELQKQTAAKRAMTDPFKEENNWFDGYDWVIRLNPDVLVRREKWLRQTMLNPDVDAILIDYSFSPRHQHKFQTDFYAFRPAKVNRHALFAHFSKQATAEEHLGAAFENIRASGRWAAVPGTTRNGLAARVLGRASPVIHDHGIIAQCPKYFNATDGEWYR
jgi:hypothetical protein